MMFLAATLVRTLFRSDYIKKNFIQIAKTLLILGKQNVLQRELFQYALLRNGEGITFDFEVCWMIVIILKRIQFDCSH